MTDARTIQARPIGRSGDVHSRNVLPERGPATRRLDRLGAAEAVGAALALVVVRNILGAKRQHGGSSRWGRRREAIAEFHRALHAEDAAGPGSEVASKA